MRSRGSASRVTLWPQRDHSSGLGPHVKPAAQAAAVRAAAGAMEAAPFNVEAYVKSLGWAVEARRLAASSGALQACLLPVDSGFHFVVDPEPTPKEAWAAAFETPTAHFRFRLAHELGHTFFYQQGSPPRRPTRASEDEERHCDGFAALLLVPPQTAAEAYTRGATSVIEAAQAYDAPIAAVLTSAAARGAPTYALGGTADLSRERELVVSHVSGHIPLVRSWARNRSLAHSVATARTAESRFSYLVLGSPGDWSVATAAA